MLNPPKIPLWAPFVFFALLAINGSAAPILLHYNILGSTKPASQPLNAIFTEIIDGTSSATANSFRKPSSFSLDLFLEISADGTTISISNLTYTDNAVGLMIVN